MNTFSSGTVTRNYGIDLLRIVSMFMIIVLHIINHGGVLTLLTSLSPAYEIAWFLEIACYCAVNCYALISGYIGCMSRFKYSRILLLWLQTAFYSVLISAITAKLSPEVGISEFYQSFFPVCNHLYWYFTAYFCLSFFTPFLNKMLAALDEKQLKQLGLTIFLLFSVLPAIIKEDLFLAHNGYSFLWLSLLYLLGGIIKRCHIEKKQRPSVALFIYLLLILLTWAVKYIVDCHTIDVPDIWTEILVNYTSPLILLSAIMLLIVFSTLKTGKTSITIISFLSPLTFGVYLIHDNPYIRHYIIEPLFPSAPTSFGLIATILIGGFALYLTCSLIDFLRQKLFDLFKIKSFFIRLENRFISKS